MAGRGSDGSGGGSVAAACYYLTGGEQLVLRAKGVELVGEAGGEKPRIRRDAGEVSIFARNNAFQVTMQVHGDGIEVTNIKVTGKEAVSVGESTSAEVKDCDLQGQVQVNKHCTHPR